MSVAAGRGLFFGGISPAAMRSWTFTHRSTFSASLASHFRAVRSSPPFLASASWHELQCASKNLVGGAARPVAVSAKAAKNVRRSGCGCTCWKVAYRCRGTRRPQSLRAVAAEQLRCKGGRPDRGSPATPCRPSPLPSSHNPERAHVVADEQERVVQRLVGLVFGVVGVVLRRAYSRPAVDPRSARVTFQSGGRRRPMLILPILTRPGRVLPSGPVFERCAGPESRVMVSAGSVIPGRVVPPLDLAFIAGAWLLAYSSGSTPGCSASTAASRHGALRARSRWYFWSGWSRSASRGCTRSTACGGPRRTRRGRAGRVASWRCSCGDELRPQAQYESRGAMVMFAGATLVGVVATARELDRDAPAPRRGVNQSHALVVGTGRLARRTVRTLRTVNWSGIQPVGYVEDESHRGPAADLPCSGPSRTSGTRRTEPHRTCVRGAPAEPATRTPPGVRGPSQTVVDVQLIADLPRWPG